MKIFKLMFLTLIPLVTIPLYSFVKETQGIMVMVSDYAIRGQRHVLPKAGINAQDFVNKGVYPIKISITNKSNELVTISADSIGLVQQDYDLIRKKLNHLSTHHIVCLFAGSLAGFLGLRSVKIALVGNAHKKFDAVLSAVFYGTVSAVCFGYTWYDSKMLSEKITKSLEEISIKEITYLQPGASIDKFIFIDQATYNRINTCNIILKKGGDSIAFQLPLD